MSALICGSLAYDTIMVFPDQFKNHILPDKVPVSVRLATKLYRTIAVKELLEE